MAAVPTSAEWHYPGQTASFDRPEVAVETPEVLLALPVAPSPASSSLAWPLALQPVVLVLQQLLHQGLAVPEQRQAARDCLAELGQALLVEYLDLEAALLVEVPAVGH